MVTFNYLKPFIKILTRSACYFSVISQIYMAAISQTGKWKGLDWVKAGSDVIQVVQSTQTQTQINMATSVRSATSEKIRLKSIVADIL